MAAAGSKGYSKQQSLSSKNLQNCEQYPSLNNTAKKYHIIEVHITHKIPVSPTTLSKQSKSCPHVVSSYNYTPKYQDDSPTTSPLCHSTYGRNLKD